jgi:hypothetical protein
VLQYLLISPSYDLHRDEYLHLDQAKHLAWGYLSVPPFTSWISWIILQLGNAVFWVKFFPALFGVLTLWLVWEIIREAGGGLFARCLGATVIVFSALMRLNMLYQPNSADVFFWTLVYFALIKQFSSGNPKWLYLAAMAFGFGFLNKYNIAFLAAGVFPALLIARRNIFKTKELYLAAGLALLIISPNLFWQYANGFPVIGHMNELAETQLVNVDRADFVKEQLLFFIGSIYVIVAGLIAPFLCRNLKTYRFVPLSFAFTIALFIYCRAKGYYAIGLYPVIIALGAAYLEMLLHRGWKRYLRPVVIAIPILLFIPIVRIAFPIYSPKQIAENSKRYKKLGLLRWEDGKDHALPQDFADMLGWKELAKKVDSAYGSIPDKKHTLILCDNYGQAGAINYYTKYPQLQAVSFNADYIGWFPKVEYRNAITVKDETDEDPERRVEKPLFESVELAGVIDNPLARECGTKIYILRNAKADINERISKEANQHLND